MVVVTVGASVALLVVLGRYMRRNRQITDPKHYRRVLGLGRRSRTSAPGIKSPNGGEYLSLKEYLD